MAFQTRFQPVSNQGDWQCAIYMSDRTSGDPIDLVGSNITSEIVAQLIGDTVPSYFITGGSDTGEITYPSPGYLQVFFPVARMQAMKPGSYRVGLTIANGVYTRQLILGLLPIVDGVIGLTSTQWSGYS